MDSRQLALLTNQCPANLNTEVEEIVNRSIKTLESRLGREFAVPTIEYNARMGTTAGEAYFYSNVVRINLSMLLDNNLRNDILNRTVPHEVAHLVAFQLSPSKGRGHGNLWRMCMNYLGLKADRCHQYDVTEHKVRKTRQYEYLCPMCQASVILGANRHMKAQTETQIYFHATCGASRMGRPLIWTGREIKT